MIGKRLLKSVLPFRVRSAGHAGLKFPFGLKFDHFSGQIRDRVFDGQFLFGPRLVADLSQHRLSFGTADVLLNQIDL